MLRIISSLAFSLCATLASAEDCPAFYRFVDFGLESRDGGVFRGGALFRAEGFDGQPLLLGGGTECRVVPETAKDGRGNPIPVVSGIRFDPDKTGIDLKELRLAKVADTKALADQNAAAHRERLQTPGTMTTRGDTFLCARAPDADGLSCQFQSPYPATGALVVYCDASHCKMPVLAMDDHLLVSALWARGPAFSGDPDKVGAAIAGRVQAIHDFLLPLSSPL